MGATLSIRMARPFSGDRALRAAARFWFAVVVIGQLLFASSVAAFYGRAAGRGDFDAWNRLMTHGYVPGEPVGNAAVGIHLASAVVIILGGALQLLPQIRTRAPAFHRWNGRVYIAAAFMVSLAGLYMLWFRGTIGDLSQHLGQSLDGVLIMVCAIAALRAALARDFRSHGRWAMRLYLVVSASLFIRAGLILSLPLGISATASTGWFFTMLSFGQYLVPLAVLELYWRARDHAGALGRVAMATGLSVLTLLLGGGIAGATMSLFLPDLELAIADRYSISEPLAATLAASGPDAAARQYNQIRSTRPTAYDFSEAELNRLGYKLLRAQKFDQAIRIFELNAQAYPRSANVYDSLAEGYMDAGDSQRAVANYGRSLQLNPGNSNAARMLRELDDRREPAGVPSHDRP